jgi:ubiquinone/menaquinone biosynthesis C-methylase UbiE/uncharacterized protein YbaR (Trm112 family)
MSLTKETETRALLEVLCYPTCRGSLIQREGGLSCGNCGAQYPWRDGILRFFTASADPFLVCEKLLFEEMKKPKHAFTSLQWQKSEEHFIQVVLDRIGDVSGKVVLHVGCGVDSFIQHFNKSRLYFSADIVEEMLEATEAKGASNKFRIQCTVEALPLKLDCVDVILCTDLIQHFYTREIGKPLRELIRVLRHGGLLFLEEPNKYSLYRLPYSCLPLPVLNVLRDLRSHLTNRYGKPEYEAPLSLFKVKRLLREISRELNKGELITEVIACREYPNLPKPLYDIYGLVGKLFTEVHKHLGFHWFLVCSLKPGTVAPSIQTSRCVSGSKVTDRKNSLGFADSPCRHRAPESQPQGSPSSPSVSSPCFHCLQQVLD